MVDTFGEIFGVFCAISVDVKSQAQTSRYLQQQKKKRKNVGMFFYLVNFVHVLEGFARFLFSIIRDDETIILHAKSYRIVANLFAIDKNEFRICFLLSLRTFSLSPKILIQSIWLNHKTTKPNDGIRWPKLKLSNELKSLTAENRLSASSKCNCLALSVPLLSLSCCWSNVQLLPGIEINNSFLAQLEKKNRTWNEAEKKRRIK